MTIRTMTEAEKVLASYRPAVKEFLGKDITLDRMNPLMQAIGNPQQKLRIVHIAGTSGKTSTAHYIATILQLTGSTVGLTASPHVDSLLERVQINGHPISEQEFCAELSGFLDKIADITPRPSYYELLVAFAYYYFNKVGVDFAVIETGLGGLQDGTNVASNPDKLCIITDIGYDHMKVLGHALPEIAAQKAGIIHPGNYVVMFRQIPEVMEVFEAHCRQAGAQLQIIRPELVNDFVFHARFPLYQQRNWTLAWSAYQRLANVYDLPVLAGELIEQSRQVTIPGRMEIIKYQDKTLILDGAHNTQKMTAFVSSFKALYPDQKPTVLLSVRDRKDFTDLIKQLFPLTNKLILTSFHVSQDIEHQNAHLEEMRQFCIDNGFSNVLIEADQFRAFKNLMEDKADIKVITGSFYLIHQIKEQQGL